MEVFFKNFYIESGYRLSKGKVLFTYDVRQKQEIGLPPHPPTVVIKKSEIGSSPLSEIIFVRPQIYQTKVNFKEENMNGEFLAIQCLQ